MAIPRPFDHIVVPLIFSLTCLYCVSIRAQVDRHHIDSLEQVLVHTETVDDRLSLLSMMLENTIFMDTEEAATYVARYQKEAKEADIGVEIARGYNFEGMLAWVEGRTTDAITAYHRAVDMYKELDDPFMRGMMNNNIGTLYETIDVDRSIEYFTLARAQFVSLDTLNWVANVDHNLGNMYSLKENYTTALEYYEKAMDGMLRSGDERNLITCHSGAGRSLMQLGRYEEALERQYLAKDLIDNTVDLGTATVIYFSICELLTRRGELEKAGEYCRLSEETVRGTGAIQPLINSARVNYLYHKAIDDNTAALAYLERFKLLNDSISSTEKTKAATDLLAKYETKEKEQQIEMQELVITQNEKEKKRTYAIAGLLGLLFIGGVVYALGRVKNNRILREKNAVIRQNLADKELLLKEIHHRVKNNLQVVSSLLSIQSREIEDEKALQAVNESRNRVKSMALIHQDLYGEDDLKGIDAKKYVEKLSRSLFNSYRVDKGRVTLVNEVDEVSIDVDTIIPLGLILNELISNALKYAFPDDRQGRIDVSLRLHEDILRLSVRDDGVGGTEEVDQVEESFGMTMIRAFAKKLDADWKVINDNGTTVRLDIRNFNLT